MRHAKPAKVIWTGRRTLRTGASGHAIAKAKEAPETQANLLVGIHYRTFTADEIWRPGDVATTNSGAQLKVICFLDCFADGSADAPISKPNAKDDLISSKERHLMHG